MKKHRLELNTLEVESFATNKDARPRTGTVFGHDSAVTYSCDAPCGTLNTADVNNTCDFYCWGGGGGGNSDFSACLDCYTNLNTCTMVEGCHTQAYETCGC